MAINWHSFMHVELLAYLVMPSEKLVPYSLRLHEYRDPDNTYNLTNLYNKDTSLPGNNIFDISEDFFDNLHGEQLRDPGNEKTFIVEDYVRNDNVIEGFISTGDYGYQAELRHVETGNLTHLKEEDEAEQLPFYFLMYLPKTPTGELYDNGQTLFIILQQINRRGIKGALKKRLSNYCVGSTTDTTLKMNPVYTEKVFEKILEANRIMRLEFEVREIPGDDESRYELIEGLSTEETGSRSIVWKPEHGGSLDRLKNVIQRATDSDMNFAELVASEVEDITATIVNDGDRAESVPLLKDKVAMRRDLEGSNLRYENGLLTAQSLRSEANDLLNDILDNDIIEPTSGGTNLG